MHLSNLRNNILIPWMQLNIILVLQIQHNAVLLKIFELQCIFPE